MDARRGVYWMPMCLGNNQIDLLISAVINITLPSLRDA